MRIKVKTGLCLGLAASLTGLLMLASHPPHGLPPNVVTTPSVEQDSLVPWKSGIAYSSGSPAQKLDLYRPDHAAAPGVVIYIHGGGFRFGTRSMASAALVKGFLEAGYAVATVDYRLSGEAPFPAAVQDIFSAVAYLKTHATTLQVDPGTIFIYGESAGANLASLVGTAYGNPSFRKNVDSTTPSLEPTAVLAHYPPVDFLKIDPMLDEQGCAGHEEHSSSRSFESAYLGAALPHVPDLVSLANPATYASSDAAPFFIQNGGADCSVGSEQSQLLVTALEKRGVTVSYELIPGAQHGGPQFETPENIKKMVQFMANVRNHQLPSSKLLDSSRLN